MSVGVEDTRVADGGAADVGAEVFDGGGTRSPSRLPAALPRPPQGTRLAGGPRPLAHRLGHPHPALWCVIERARDVARCSALARSVVAAVKKGGRQMAKPYRFVSAKQTSAE